MRRTLALLAIAALGASASAADRPWRVIHGRNVEVYGQQSPRTLRDIAVELEQFRSVLGNLVRGARQPQALPTEVYLFDTYDAMKPFLPLYQGKPAVVGGICLCGSTDDTSVILATLSRDADSSEIMYHEYSHLLLRNALSTIPVWFNEGLAEYFSTFELRHGREAQVGRAIVRHVAVLRERFIPLPQLLAVDRSSALYNEGTRRTIFYAESWALAHYLLLGRPDGQAVVNKYLNAYAAGTASADALADAVGLPIPDLEEALRKYVRRMTFPAITYTLSDRVAVDEPEAATAVPDAEAAGRLGEVQMRVDRLDEAVVRIESAAATTPPAGRAQLALARLRLRQQRRDEGWQALRKAAELSPTDFAAQYLYGLTLLRGVGEVDPAQPPGEWARMAHTALARAIGIRPDAAAPLVWLAYADLQLGANLEEARDATTKALNLAPGRLDYALQLAEIRLRLGDTAGARQLLTTIAKGHAESTEGERSAQVLRLIDERERLAREPRAAPAETDSVNVKYDNPVGSTRETLDLSKPSFSLRDVLPDEQRVFGELVAIECGPAGIFFRVRAAGGDATGRAKRMEDVELTAYGNAQALAVGCGARTPPDKVYLTRHADGTAVAVEFMPKGYVP
jgi:tetratricopeptide (TPR) repeat protein